MVSMKPIFRESAGTFFGIAFLYRLKERCARWLTQLPATSPIPVLPPLSRSGPSLRVSADCAPKSKNNFVTGRACHSGLRRIPVVVLSCLLVPSFLSHCAGEKQKRPTGQTRSKKMEGREQKQQQRQTAKEVIAANVQHLIHQLEQGHSETLTAYLTAMSHFHNYSFGNILEIARQKPDATHVAGLYTWNQLGRRVKKGEKGIRILAPIIGTKRKEQEEAEKDLTRQHVPVLVGFRAAYVFDRLSRDLRPARFLPRVPCGSGGLLDGNSWTQLHHRLVSERTARR
jgi:hypothetical protein